MDDDPDINKTPTVDWELTAVRSLLDAFKTVEGPSDRLDSKLITCHPVSNSRSLGDFSNVFEFLGVKGPPERPPIALKPISTHHKSSDSSSSQHSSYTTQASTVPETYEEFLNKGKEKEVRWNDEVSRPGKLAESAKSCTLTTITDIDSEAATQGPDSRLETETFVPKSSIRSNISEVVLFDVSPSKNTVESHGNAPSPIPWSYVDPTIIWPVRTLTPTEQKLKIIKKLRKRFSLESTSLLTTNPFLGTPYIVHPSEITNGLHVFVDFSNIIIGFYNRIKRSRGLHEKAHVKTIPFSFYSLALIMEHGRPVARRILVGSTVQFMRSQDKKRATHFLEAERCGYELNILERVCKVQRQTPTKKKHGTGNGYATSGSGSEAATIARSTMAEQGVDEILQMKLLESLVDTRKPSTVILASGDAAEAEYSGGFFKNVERALSKGWKVELVAWHDGLSSEYRDKRFLEKWSGKFSITELDDFAEDMLALYTTSNVKL